MFENEIRLSFNLSFNRKISIKSLKLFIIFNNTIIFNIENMQHSDVKGKKFLIFR